MAAEPDAGAPPPGRNVPLSFALLVLRRCKEFWGVLRLPILARDGVVRGGGVLEVALGEVEGHAGRRRRRRHQVALRQRRLLGPRALEAVHRADAGLEGAAEVVVDRVDEAAEVPQQAEHGGGREDARNAADRAVQVVLARHARAVAHLEHDVVRRPLGLGREDALLATLELRAGLQLLLPLDAAAARLLEGVHRRKKLRAAAARCRRRGRRRTGRCWLWGGGKTKLAVAGQAEFCVAPTSGACVPRACV